MRAKSGLSMIFVRVIVVVVAVALLLLPGLSMIAVAWADTNLAVAIAAIVFSILVNTWLPKLRWIAAAISSFLVVVPPYPYWLKWNEIDGWYLHFFKDVVLERFSVVVFALIFLGAMLLFSAIFWALPSKEA